MTRVIAFVDGFNLYHGLASQLESDPNSLPHNKVDLWRLIENYLLHDEESLVGVRWYSAIPPLNWRDPEQAAIVSRHAKYREQLNETGVLTRVSSFRKITKTCKHCGKKNKTREEKESDTRFALEILEDALYDRMDRALLVTSDSDFMPALYSLNRYAKSRPVDAVVCPPIKREDAGKEIQKCCRELFSTKTRYMRIKHLHNSLFTSDNSE